MSDLSTRWALFLVTIAGRSLAAVEMLRW